VKEPRAIKKKEKSALASPVEERVERLLSENQVEDLVKIGAIWALMLGLEEPILPSLAAGMMSVADIVKATTLVDSREHWQNAAVSAIIAIQADAATFARSDATPPVQIEQLEPPTKVVGFAASTDNPPAK
jgi:hypothetical protein